MYFFFNEGEQPLSLKTTVVNHGTSKQAQQWDTASGKVEPWAANRLPLASGKTTPPLELQPWGTKIVVVRDGGKVDPRRGANGAGLSRQRARRCAGGCAHRCAGAGELQHQRAGDGGASGPSPKCLVRIFQQPKSVSVLPSGILIPLTTCRLPLGSRIATGTSNLWLGFQPG